MKRERETETEMKYLKREQGDLRLMGGAVGHSDEVRKIDRAAR